MIQIFSFWCWRKFGSDFSIIAEKRISRQNSKQAERALSVAFILSQKKNYFENLKCKNKNVLSNFRKG